MFDIFLNFAPKHRLWVHVRTASATLQGDYVHVTQLDRVIMSMYKKKLERAGQLMRSGCFVLLSCLKLSK